MENVSTAPEAPQAPVLPKLLDPDTIEAVRITAADFNGHSFDGRPFAPEPANATDTLPDWLGEGLTSGNLSIAPSCTDYARWSVRDRDGHEHQAGPGDYLMWLNGRITVVPEPVWEHVIQPLINFAKSRRGHRSEPRTGMSFEGG